MQQDATIEGLGYSRKFLEKAFNAALYPCMLSILSNCATIIADGIIVGRKIGMDGLTAISLCVPVCLILCVLVSLFVSGAFTAASADIPENQAGAPEDFLTIREIRPGKRYELVITTLSGMYRYRIGDVVEVTGFFGEAPVIRICYRKDLVISLLDERMNTMQFENAVRLFAEKTGLQVHNDCVAGNWNGDIPRYTMYLETDRGLPPDVQAVMDRCLCESCPGYREVRMMNELDRAEVFRVREGTFSEYQQYRRSRGMRMEQSKPVRVLTRDDQIAFFSAARENA